MQKFIDFSILGDISSYTIDQFLFSPGPHNLTIVYNVTSGRQGEFLFNFTGEVRPSMLHNPRHGEITLRLKFPFVDYCLAKNHIYKLPC